MATQVQNRRGNTSQHSVFTGAAGEVTVDTDRKSIVVHDGTTAGGSPVPNWAAANASFIANVASGVTAASYGSATNIPILIIDAFGRVTTAANVAVQGMNYAYANSRVASVTSNSTSRIWANTITDAALSKNVFIDLATSGVTAATYGSATNIPIVTIDTYGRVTSAANVAVNGMDYPFANTKLANTSGTVFRGDLYFANGNVGIDIASASPTSFYVNGSAAATINTLVDGATVTPIFGGVAGNNNFTLTLGGNRAVANPTQPTAGQSGTIYIIQDATGSRTLTWGNTWKFQGNTAPTLSITGGTVDMLVYSVRTTANISCQLINNIG